MFDLSSAEDLQKGNSQHAHASHDFLLNSSEKFRQVLSQKDSDKFDSEKFRQNLIQKDSDKFSEIFRQI